MVFRYFRTILDKEFSIYAASGQSTLQDGRLQKVAEKGCTMEDFNIETMGERLKRLRNGKNLSQDQMSQLLGVSISSISSYEIDVRQPPYDILAKYSSIFHVSTDYLIGSSKEIVIDASGLDQQEVSIIAGLVEGMAEKNKELKRYKK